MFGLNSIEELKKYQKNRRRVYEEASLSPDDSIKMFFHLLSEFERLEMAVFSQEKNFKEVMGISYAEQSFPGEIDSSSTNQSAATEFDKQVAARVREILDGSPLTEEEKNGPFHYTEATNNHK